MSSPQSDRRTAPASPNPASVWSERIDALDGIRGMAILLVILFHHTLMRPETPADRVYVSVARLGWSGVDLFFALSGFLITGVLLGSKGGAHYFRNFYLRRTLRIFPLYYAFVFFTLRVSPQLWPDTELAGMGRAAMADRSEAWYWLYGSNLLFAADAGFGHPNLAVTWSLAIEEQFYLVWPLVVAIAGRRTLLWACGAMIAGALLLRIALLADGAHWVAPYVLPFCRMDALAAGALVAVLIGRGAGAPVVPPARLRPHAKIIALAAAVAFAAVWMAEDPLNGGDWTEPLMQTAGFTALATGFGSLIALVVTGGSRDWLQRLFRLRVLRIFGRYSYALYLFHVPVRRFVRDYCFPVAEFQTWLGSPLPGQLLFYAVATAPALALAWASWHLLEQPCLRLKRFFPYGSGPDGGRGDTNRGPGRVSRPA